MADIKLGRLPDRTPIKVSISLVPSLLEDLTAYAGLYRSTYGKEETVADLVPAMLRSFLDSDRVFLKHRQEGR
jgi:hypothetical protein